MKMLNLCALHVAMQAKNFQLFGSPMLLMLLPLVLQTPHIMCWTRNVFETLHVAAVLITHPPKTAQTPKENDCER
jgi:hypothetical protein